MKCLIFIDIRRRPSRKTTKTGSSYQELNRDKFRLPRNRHYRIETIPISHHSRGQHVPSREGRQIGQQRTREDKKERV